MGKKIAIYLTWTIVASFLFGMLYFGLYKGVYQRSKLKNNYRLVNGGIIIKLSSVHKTVNSYYVEYSYIIDNTSFVSSNKRAFNFTKDASQYLFEQSFPVAYSPDNPSNALILIKPEDFRELGLNYPDSLKKIQGYILAKE